MHPIELGLSFVEGLALIASPCILPVLPLVLSTSVEGGRKRPFGIILGFVLAFTLFALLSRKLVMAFGIDLDVIKNGSLILLALFGLVLLSESLSNRFSSLTQRFANAGNTLSTQAKDGFFSGVLIGMLIGLVWTPCAGPILAAVLVQVIRQESDLQAFFLVASFAFGASMPMLIIALTGRKLMSKLGFLTSRAESVRKAFGVILLLAVAFIASGIDINTLLQKPETETATHTASLQNALPTPYPAPDFAPTNTWLNSVPLTVASLKGKVVLVDFWTYSCINCVRTLPHLTDWDKKYRKHGLVVIGVHAPEFEFEKDRQNVESAIAAHHIAYPVALDNTLDTWTNYKNRYWPAHYLINKEGQVVYTHFGEGNYAITENNIRFLLGLAPLGTEPAETTTHTSGQTPETYLGSDRAENYASPEDGIDNTTQTFTFPETLPEHHWALSGQWRIEPERLIAKEQGASLRLHFTAAKVFLVLGTANKTPIKVNLTLNGTPHGSITVTANTLYPLIAQPEIEDGILEITTESEGLEAYAFTFGS